MKIFKYVLNYHNVAELVRLPKGAKVLSGGIQDLNPEGVSVLWVLVDENEPEKEERVFAVMFTGNELPGRVKEYFGTNYNNSSNLVFHFMELHHYGCSKIYDPKEDSRLNT